MAKKLGFGCMRLPLLNKDDQTSVDLEPVRVLPKLDINPRQGGRLHRMQEVRRRLTAAFEGVGVAEGRVRRLRQRAGTSYQISTG